MKIVNWNLWDNNNNIKKSLNHVFSNQPNIVCLQEFDEKFKYHLQDYPDYDFFFSNDFEISRNKKKTTDKYKLVIGTKKQIRCTKNKIIFRKRKKPNIIKKLTGWKECLEFQYIDFKFNKKKIRLFNIHLSCAASHYDRIKEFRKILKEFKKDRINIICGDFNIFGKPSYNFLIGWLFGFSLKEQFINERKEFEDLFSRYGFKNIFKSFVTYPLFLLQPDHILIPNEIKVKNHSRNKKSIIYSDHQMISANIKI